MATVASPGSLVIGHTNDLHAHFNPESAPWLTGRPAIGGFVAIDAHLDALRAEVGEDSVLYLDGGDILTGTPLMEVERYGTNGGAMLDLLQAAGCDAWALGNHEFDRGWDNVSGIVAASKVPVVSANVRAAGVDRPAFPTLQEHVILERSGLKIGVFGLTTTSLKHLGTRETMSHVDVRPLAEVAREQVAALEPQVDLVVALTHTGLDADRAVAAEVDGIDLIVGGHSHTALQEAVRVSGTWIVQAGSYGRQLGVLRLQVDDGELTSFSSELRDLVLEDLPGPASPDVRALVSQLEAGVAERFERVIGELPADLLRAGALEQPLGAWAAEVVRGAAGADVGIYNPGGLRADLFGGPLKLGALYAVFPFSNAVVRFDMTGEELERVVRRTATNALVRDYRPLQFAGLRWQWSKTADGAREYAGVVVGAGVLEPGRVYSVATNSYVAEQWEKNLGVDPGGVAPVGMTVLEAAQRAVEAGLIAPPEARSVSEKPGS